MKSTFSGEMHDRIIKARKRMEEVCEHFEFVDAIFCEAMYENKRSTRRNHQLIKEFFAAYKKLNKFHDILLPDFLLNHKESLRRNRNRMRRVK